MKIKDLLSKLDQLAKVGEWAKHLKGNKLLLLVVTLLVTQQVYFSCQKDKHKTATDMLMSQSNVTIFQKDEQIQLLDKELQEEIEKKEIAVRELYQFKADIESRGTVENVKTEVVYKDKEIISYIESDLGINAVPGGVYRATGPNSFREMKSFRFSLEDDTLQLYAIATPNYDTSESHPFNIKAEYRLKINIVGQMLRVIEDTGEKYHLRLFKVQGDKIVDGIPIKHFNVLVKDLRLSRIRWWTPKIDLGLIGRIKQAGPLPIGSVGFSTSGYGNSEDGLYIRFPRVSIDFMEDSVGLGITPVVLNLGAHAPLISDLYTGIHFGINEHEKYVGVLLGTVL